MYWTAGGERGATTTRCLDTLPPVRPVRRNVSRGLKMSNGLSYGLSDGDRRHLPGNFECSMTATIYQLDTWYIPEGETHHVGLPSFKIDGQDRCLVCDDRGDLLVPVYVQEADHDGLLLLKQFGAAPALIETVRAAQEYGDIDPSGRLWAVSRTETGYQVEEAVGDASDLM